MTPAAIVSKLLPALRAQINCNYCNVLPACLTGSASTCALHADRQASVTYQESDL